MRFLTRLIILFVISLGLESGAQTSSPTWEAVRLNDQGVELLKKQNFSAAQEKFVQALGKSPFLAPIHLNLGLAFYGGQQVEKAQASYETARKLAKDDQTKFIALFNLGELNGKAHKTDEALSFYQAALELKPDSIETKTSIELLIQSQQNQKDSKDDQGGKGGKGNKDDKDKDKDKDQDKDKEKDKDKDQDKPKNYQKNKPQPRPFKSEDLTQADVNKILGELKQQEQKIRSEYNRREAKEKPRDKDW